METSGTIKQFQFPKVLLQLLEKDKELDERIKLLKAKDEELTRRLQLTEDQVKILFLINTSCYSNDFKMIKTRKSIYIGESFKVRQKSDRSPFSLYKIPIEMVDGTKKLKDRIQSITELRHDHLIQFRKFWIEMDEDPMKGQAPVMYVLTDYTDKITLDATIRKSKFDSSFRQTLFVQLVEILEYLHRKNVVHGNLRRKTIYYENPKQLKVGDFGIISQKGNDFMKDQVDYLKSLVNDFGLSKTESLESFDIGRKVDLFSLGIVYFYMCFPKNEQGESDALHKIAYGTFGTPIPHITTEDAKTIKTLLNCFKSQSSVAKMLADCKSSVTKLSTGYESLLQTDDSWPSFDSPEPSPKKSKLVP